MNLKKYNMNLGASLLREDQYHDSRKDIVVEAKRLILNEQTDRIINVTLCDIFKERPLQIKHRSCKQEITSQTLEIIGNVPAPYNSLKIIQSSINKSAVRKKCGHETQQIFDKIEIIKRKHEKIAENRKMLQKYFNIWKRGTKTKTVENKIEIKTLGDFFKKLVTQKKSPTKNKDSTNIKNESKNAILKIPEHNTLVSNKESECLGNRYKAQQDIILMQKTKLLEQERVIQDLKHGKICEELNQSIIESRQQLKEMLLRSSVKTKCKVGVPTEFCEDQIEIRINKAPKIIQKMERRAQERLNKRAVIQERKRLIDEERKRLAQELIENKKFQDEEEKRKNLEAIKERRRNELELEKQKQILRQMYISNCDKADSFYKQKLRKRTINRFYILMDNAEKNLYRCELLFQIIAQRKCFNNWQSMTRCNKHEKFSRARNLYRTNVLKKCFKGFRMNHVRAKQNYQVAVDFFDYRLQCKVFKYLHIYVCKARMVQYNLQIKAVKHYNYRILVQYFYQWKTLNAVLELEKVKERKKKKWREKVLQILPDYKPPLDILEF